MNRTPTLAVGLALAAGLALAGCQKTEDAAFGTKVRAYLMQHPEILEEMAVKLRENQQLKVQAASRDAISKYRQQLERDPRDFVANPEGTVTVVEFFDYNCGYCKLAAPEVANLIQQNPDVRFVFKEFAFQTENSVTAARIVLTPMAKPKGLALYKLLMAQKPLSAEAIDRSLVAVGLDPVTVRRAAADPAIEQQISDTHDLARALGIDGTPAFIVGGQIVHGADMEALRKAIAEARKGLMKPPSSPA